MRKKGFILEVKDPWPKEVRSFDAELIPNKLKELALAGIYYESKVLP